MAPSTRTSITSVPPPSPASPPEPTHPANILPPLPKPTAVLITLAGKPAVRVVVVQIKLVDVHTECGSENMDKSSFLSTTCERTQVCEYAKSSKLQKSVNVIMTFSTLRQILPWTIGLSFQWQLLSCRTQPAGCSLTHIVLQR